MKIRANTTFYSIVLCRLDIEGFRVIISRFFINIIIIISIINATRSDEVTALASIKTKQQNNNHITFRYLVSGCLKMRVT